MKNIAINALGYTGRVTLSQCIGDKKIKVAEIHNSGGEPLFNFISDCLIGDFDTARLNRPNKIMLLKKVINSSDNSISYTSMSDYIYILTNPEKVYDPSRGRVRYSFVITRDKLDDASFDHIGLYTENTSLADISSYAAICEVPSTDINLTVASALVIDWELIISNNG